jgi:hypothetical protein
MQATQTNQQQERLSMSNEQRYLFVTLDGVPAPELHVPIPWMNGYGPMRIKRHDRDVSVTKDGVTFKAWRDDLRKGWHVVPEGVRYVGVSGAVAGQNCAPFGCGFNASRAAARLNAGTESASLIAWHVPEWSKMDDTVGSVLDLHDLADHRKPDGVTTTIVMGDSFDTSPRAVAKRIRETEWKFQARQGTTLVTDARTSPTLKGMTWTECAVDEPKGPSDAEIVEIHGWTLNEIPTPMPVGWTYEEGSPSWRDRVYSLRGHRVTRQEREAAWSRELKRRSEATKEAERRGVLGPIDDPEHA